MLGSIALFFFFFFFGPLIMFLFFFYQLYQLLLLPLLLLLLLTYCHYYFFYFYFHFYFYFDYCFKVQWIEQQVAKRRVKRGYEPTKQKINFYHRLKVPLKNVDSLFSTLTYSSSFKCEFCCLRVMK